MDFIRQALKLHKLCVYLEENDSKTPNLGNIGYFKEN